MSTRMELSKQVLYEAIMQVVAKQSAGMLCEGQIKSVRAVTMGGQAFDFDKIQVEVAPPAKTKASPSERATKTGTPMRLVTFEGELVA